MSGMTSDSGNMPKDGNNFPEMAVPANLDVNAPRELVDNASDVNETVVKELASKFNEVSLGEREAALYDIHGVAPNLEGDPETLSKSLKEMNEMLTIMLCWKKSSAFKLAESQSPEYSRNEKLLLMFLRCESFNVKAAATRLVAFFRYKLSLFGPEKLCKETIGQNDLDTEDLKCVAAGFWQLLPRRDHIGRAQLIFIPPCSQWTTHDNFVSGPYLCMPKQTLKWTFEEIEQQLAAFGINGVNLAISCEGDLKVDRHKGMLRSLKCLEAQTTSAEDYVVLPTHTDVLLGRGKPIQNHPGNLRVSLIVESLLEECDVSENRLATKQLAAEAVDRMKVAGVRFLTKSNEGWKIAPDSLARERVIRNFRTVRERLKIQERAPLDPRLGNDDFHANRNKRMLENR
eukprot:scaffold4880_cov106-Cylindrotheca_fusiformis.AAC.8